MNDDCEFTKALLIDIATKNKVKEIGKKDNKDLIIKKIADHFSADKKLPEQNKMSESQSVKEIIEAGFKKELSDNDMIIQIINSGVEYKSAIKQFETVAQELGLRLSNKQRKEKARSMLVEKEFEPTEYSEVTAMVEAIAKEIPDTEFSQALLLVKKYCKEMEITIPKPEKKAAGGFRAEVFKFIRENVEASKDDFAKWITETKEKELKIVDRYWPVFELAKSVLADSKIEEEETE